MFANGPGDRDSILGRVIPKTKKKNDTWCRLLKSQHYKVRIKSKVVQSSEWSSAPPHLCVEVIEKEAFGAPSTTVADNYPVYVRE